MSTLKNIYYEGQVLWAQVDANFHLRHSAYADLAAQARLNLLSHVGLSVTEFALHHMGPVLFREELVYLREIGLNDSVRVTVVLSKTSHQNSRFSFHHEIYRSDNTKCAIINVDGAWIDTAKRKLTLLPESWQAFFEKIPRSEDFVSE